MYSEIKSMRAVASRDRKTESGRGDQTTRHGERRLSSNELRVEEVKRATLVKDIRRLS
jgi:hypothetical protein